MKFLILGSKGMLGSMAKSFFEKSHEVLIFDDRFTKETSEDYLNHINKLNFDVLLNCIGRIPQKSLMYDELYFANTFLPVQLASLEKNFLLVHPSTDCVFSGVNRMQPYVYDEKHDFKDDYGKTKSLAESFVLKRNKSLVIRTSIIGTTKNYMSKGLLDWFLSQKDNYNFKGFSNHYWNGITTLEWCKFLSGFLKEGRNYKTNFIQLSSSAVVSKYDLLTKFKEIYEKQCEIEMYKTETTINRSLKGQIELKSIEEQLKDLKNFKL